MAEVSEGVGRRTAVRAVQVSLVSRASVSREPYKCLSRAVQVFFVNHAGTSREPVYSRHVPLYDCKVPLYTRNDTVFAELSFTPSPAPFAC